MSGSPLRRDDTRGPRANGYAWRTCEQQVVAAMLRRLPRGATRRLRAVLQRRYATPQGPIVTAQMRRGHRLLLDLRSRVQATAYFSGSFDDDLLEIALRLLDRPGAVAFDIGANIGLWTIPLAIRAREIAGRVVAFEPVTANRRRLVDNLRLNGVWPHADIVAAAVSDTVGTTELALRDDFLHGASTGNASIVIDDGADRGLRRDTSATVPLDGFRRALGGDAVRVIKLDVEGHEDHVLRGARALLAASRPTVIAEWNTTYFSRRQLDPRTAVDPILTAVGYQALRRTSSGWQPQPGFTSPKDLDNLLLVPRERTGELVDVANHAGA
jgi:FkbM family methyltransferase